MSQDLDLWTAYHRFSLLSVSKRLNLPNSLSSRLSEPPYTNRGVGASHKWEIAR